MEDTKRHLETLTEIRSLMERSNRFLSLSGLSGVWAGFCALGGAALVYVYLGLTPFSADEGYYYEKAINTVYKGMDYKRVFVLIAFMVLVTALAGGMYFTTRKARRQGLQMWDATTWRLIRALALPLATGGVFCLELLYWNLPALIAPATLIFYGLALVNGSKYTLGDVYWLGVAEIVLGLIGGFFLFHGLELWALGFGILHIGYGTWMYRKYGG
jgi:hypothetical protein